MKTDTGRALCEDRKRVAVRHWQAKEHQGGPVNPQQLATKRQRRIIPYRFQREHYPADTFIWIVSLQRQCIVWQVCSETIHFWCRKPPRLWATTSCSPRKLMRRVCGGPGTLIPLLCFLQSTLGPGSWSRPGSTLSKLLSGPAHRVPPLAPGCSMSVMCPIGGQWFHYHSVAFSLFVCSADH